MTTVIEIARRQSRPAVTRAEFIGANRRFNSEAAVRLSSCSTAAHPPTTG